MYVFSSDPTHSFPSTRRERQIVNNLHRQRAAQIVKIANAAREGDVRAARRYTRSFFSGKNCKASHLILSGHQTGSIEDLLSYSQGWDVSAPYSEPVLIKRKKGSSSGHRQICTLPSRLKASHKMIASVIQAQTPNNDAFFHKKGGGRDRCVQKALNLLLAGFRYVSHIDINNCHPSVNLDILSFLPAQEKYLRNTLRPENLKFKMKPEREKTEAIRACKTLYSYQDVCHSDGPTGLMQGSPASAAILSWILQDIPLPDALDGHVLVYADDILILASTIGKRREIERAVIQYLQGHPAGPFEMATKPYRLNHPFDFLGYEFSFIGSLRHPITDISQQNLNKLERKLGKALQEDARCGNTEPVIALAKLDQVLKGHSNAHLLEQLRETYAETLWDWNLPNAIRSELQ